MRVVRIVVTVGVLAWPAFARAEAIGIFSFDSLIPGPGGVNAFTVINLTDGNQLPPDFQVSTALTFLGVQLTATVDGGGAMTHDLGDVHPGVSDLQVPDSDVFASATLTFSLSSLQFLLGDGSTFQASSQLVSATILPGIGTALSPGDFIVLDVDGTRVDGIVPEPSTLVLFGTGILALSRARARRNIGS